MGDTKRKIPDDYVNVHVRLANFNDDEGGEITTAVYEIGGFIFIKARAEQRGKAGEAHAYWPGPDDDDDKAFEKCESSAVGRALRAIGYAARGERPAGGGQASQDDRGNAAAEGPPEQKEPEIKQPGDPATDAQKNAIVNLARRAEKGVSKEDVAELYSFDSLTKGKASEIIKSYTQD